MYMKYILNYLYIYALCIYIYTYIYIINYIYVCRCTCMVYTYTQMHASTYVHVQRGQMSPENLAFRIPGRRHSASGRLLFAAGCAAARGSATATKGRECGIWWVYMLGNVVFIASWDINGWYSNYNRISKHLEVVGYSEDFDISTWTSNMFFFLWLKMGCTHDLL